MNSSMEHAQPLAGMDHPDALYRAAGWAAGDAGPVRTASTTRSAICPCCTRKMQRVMRVRVTNSDATESRWVALCAMCAASMLSTNPRTIVGGRIRPRLRNAG